MVRESQERVEHLRALRIVKIANCVIRTQSSYWGITEDEAKRQIMKEIMCQAKKFQLGSLVLKGCKQEELDQICVLERALFGSLEDAKFVGP